jgi:serine/threonine protein kinase
MPIAAVSRSSVLSTPADGHLHELVRNVRTAPAMRFATSRKWTTGTLLAPGTCFTEDLRITSVLGQGGMSVVYAAHHRVLAREVAIKVALPRHPEEYEARNRLRREAYLCASIKSPYVPKIYALEKLPDGTPYILMERVSGKALSSLIEERRLSLPASCRIVCEVLRALSAVHRAGVVHRDIKPDNIMVRGSADRPKVTIIDFGIGKLLRPSPTYAVLTLPGALLGTPLYMAPEQLSAGIVDHRADIFAVGAVLYELTCGVQPHAAASLAEVFSSVLRDVPAPIHMGVPRPYAAAIMRALEKDADNRQGSAEELLHELLVAEPELGDAVPSVTSPMLRVVSALEDAQTVVFRQPYRRRKSLRSQCARRPVVPRFMPSIRDAQPPV